MAHIPTTPGKPLGVMRRYQAPRAFVFSRSSSPPVPGLEAPETENPRAVEAAVGGGTKQELVGISKRSSLNLVRLLSTLDWEKAGQCYHVSLTYGRNKFPSSKDDLAAEKSALVSYLGRTFDCGIWRLEYQSRETPHERWTRELAGLKRVKGQGGSWLVPHWHVLLWDSTRDPCDVESWLRGWWKRFSGNASRYGVQLRVRDARATWYLSLHAGKQNQSPPFAVGRWWGYINRDRVLASCDAHCTGEVQERELVWVARLYRRATGARTRNAKGFTWFLPRRSQYEVLAWVRSQIASERESKHGRKDPF